MSKERNALTRLVICVILAGIMFFFRISTSTAAQSLDKRISSTESQAQSENNWTANPQFFAARSDQQRCAAISLWLLSIRQGASTMPKSFGSGGGDVMNSIQSQDVVKLAAPAFEGVFGKPFSELSEGERKQIAKSLKSCSSELWVETILASVFKLPDNSPQLKGWAGTFERYKDAKYLISKQQTPLPPRFNDAPLPSLSAEMRQWNRAYNAGELLLETDIFRLHVEAGGLACTPGPHGGAYIVLIFKGGENYEIRNNEEYWQRIDKEVLPALLKRCSPISQVQVKNYVAGFFLGSREVSTTPQSDARSLPISSASFKVPLQPSSRYWGDYDYIRMGNDEPPASVARLRNEIIRQDTERVARREQEAESKRLAYLAQDRVSHRAQAAKYLQLLKKGAPEQYDFSEYEHQRILESIYTGDFELFTGGYNSEELSLVNFFNGALSKNNTQYLDLMSVARVRAPIRIAYFIYHQMYEKQCHSNQEFEWKTATFRTDVEVWKGVTFDRLIPGQIYTYKVREPFGELLLDTYEAAKKVGFSDILMRFPISLRDELARDFQKLLQAEGCASPALRHFEINLYLATKWMLPLQELRAQSAAQLAKQSFLDSSKNYKRFHIGGYTRTDYQVRQGERINITAFGAITLGLGAGTSPPEGVDGLQPYNLFRNVKHGALMVRVRQDQNTGWVYCGNQCTFTPDRDGFLEFTVNDKDSSNNGGRYLVRVQRER